MKNYQAADVDAYILGMDAAARPHLQELREIIKSVVPGAAESISWGVPFYKYQGLLAGIAAFKNHVSFGLVTVLSADDRLTLEKKGYRTGKKTIQIRFNQKVPTTIISRILKAKAKSNQSKKAAK